MSNKLKIKNKNNKMEINIDQDKMLDSVIAGIEYTMVKDILVKPLDTPKVMKHIVEQVPTDQIDEETKATIYETKESDKEVDSAFRKGIVLKLPTNLPTDSPIEVGDTIVFPYKFSIDFDLFKDSMLVKPYDVIALVKKANEQED